MTSRGKAAWWVMLTVGDRERVVRGEDVVLLAQSKVILVLLQLEIVVDALVLLKVLLLPERRAKGASVVSSPARKRMSATVLVDRRVEPGDESTQESGTDRI